MKLNQTRTLYDYWRSLRKGVRVPARQDIEPSAIARVLGDTFILETLPGHRFRFRLAGTRVGEMFGFEPKGADILNFWPAHDREAVQSLLFTVTEDNAGALIGFTMTTEDGSTASGELIALPLRHLDGTVSRIIGTCALFTQPFWLGAQKLHKLEISSLRLLWPDESPDFMQRRAAVASEIHMGDAPLVFPTPMPGKRVAHLMVYDGGQKS